MQNNKIILAKNTTLPAGCHNILVAGVCASGKTYNYVYPNLLQCSGSYVVVDNGGYMKEKTEDMFKSNGYKILTVNLRADPTATISIAELISIGQQPTVLYIIPHIRDNRANEATISDIITGIYEKAASAATVHIHILADEFPQYGKALETLYLFMSARHPMVSCSIIIQTFPQLQWMFNEKWIMFVGVCDAVLFLSSPVDVNTNNILMQMLGFTITDNERLLLRIKHPACCTVIAGQEPMFDEIYDTTSHPNYTG